MGATFDEINFETKVWSIPKERMKMGKAFDIPLSDHALDILKTQFEARGSNPHVFGGRPMRPLSAMGMAALLKRLGVPATVHGFRSSFRNWAADTGFVFEVAEACLAHSVGSAVTAAYLRTSMLERRRPVLASWAEYVSGTDRSNVIQMRRAGA